MKLLYRWQRNAYVYDWRWLPLFLDEQNQNKMGTSENALCTLFHLQMLCDGSYIADCCRQRQKMVMTPWQHLKWWCAVLTTWTFYWIKSTSTPCPRTWNLIHTVHAEMTNYFVFRSRMSWLRSSSPTVEKEGTVYRPMERHSQWIWAFYNWDPYSIGITDQNRFYSYIHINNNQYLIRKDFLKNRVWNNMDQSLLILLLKYVL